MGSENHLALTERSTLTDQLKSCPYDAYTFLRRAICYERLGFPDLAVGDAYRALLLTDEVQDESGEYHEQAREAIEQSLESAQENSKDDEEWPYCEDDQYAVNGDGPAFNGHTHHHTKLVGEDADGSFYEQAAQRCAFRIFVVLTRALLKCGCLKSAYEFASQGLKAFPSHWQLSGLQEQILENYRHDRVQRDPTWYPKAFDPKTDLPEQGSVRRELYSWNTHEPDRFSASSLVFLNSEIRKVAPKCEVRAVSLPLLQEHAPKHSIDPTPLLPAIQQLGIFATEDIAPHETVLHESSLLTANNRLRDPLCDACSSPLPPISSNCSPPPSCSNCDDTIFCSEICHAAAQTLYHPAVCGKPDFDNLARDPKPQTATNALYLLLLTRTIALAETQNLHPLELPQTKYLWGDFTVPDAAYVHSAAVASRFATARHLPFTFRDNVLAPLHVLEKMDIDIFAALPRCDTWVLNTLFAKFRATASARLSLRDGKPEVCAVHPMWCLANHSCAPNVRWEWGGEIRFEVRGEEDMEGWRKLERTKGQGRWGQGIRRGEEVLNHYCDVGLGVRERREWAVGALGGMCVCERCLWEERQGDGNADSGHVVGG